MERGAGAWRQACRPSLTPALDLDGRRSEVRPVSTFCVLTTPFTITCTLRPFGAIGNRRARHPRRRSCGLASIAGARGTCRPVATDFLSIDRPDLRELRHAVDLAGGRCARGPTARCRSPPRPAQSVGRRRASLGTWMLGTSTFELDVPVDHDPEQTAAASSGWRPRPIMAVLRVITAGCGGLEDDARRSGGAHPGGAAAPPAWSSAREPRHWAATVAPSFRNHLGDAIAVLEVSRPLPWRGTRKPVTAMVSAKQ